MNYESMGRIRATIVLDENIALKVKQMFKGNLSKGVNTLLQKQLFGGKKESLFGILKGKDYLNDLQQLEKEDEKAHENLYR
ncbi:MAG TPA: hypothetical protein VI874_04140 [Candidatus Norongarragalinales archaeon]|nr:hypothetical protein [Candidatus Norongarragalinales archaeon]